jgi:hypothetical protein
MEKKPVGINGMGDEPSGMFRNHTFLKGAF